MANEMLSVPVAMGTLGLAGGTLVGICRAAKRAIGPEKMPLMGILGAFIFAAQMVNFQLPFMPGTSGHFIGAVLLAIILGPHLASIVMSSVIILQCLIFQDGGILALGCNIINMAVVPCYVGAIVYAGLAGANTFQKYAATICACIIGIEAGAVLVPYEAAISGVLAVPLKTFLVAMTGVHLIIAVLEGVLTAAVLGFLARVKPDISAAPMARYNRKAVLVSFAVVAVVMAGLAGFASKLPDGLQWAWGKSENIAGKSEERMNISAAAIGGSAVVMGVVYTTALVLRKRETHISSSSN